MDLGDERSGFMPGSSAAPWTRRFYRDGEEITTRPADHGSREVVEHALDVLILLEGVHQREDLAGQVIGKLDRRLRDVLRLGGEDGELPLLDGCLQLAEAGEGAADDNLPLALLAFP